MQQKMALNLIVKAYSFFLFLFLGLFMVFLFLLYCTFVPLTCPSCRHMQTINNENRIPRKLFLHVAKENHRKIYHSIMKEVTDNSLHFFIEQLQSVANYSFRQVVIVVASYILLNTIEAVFQPYYNFLYMHDKNIKHRHDHESLNHRKSYCHSADNCLVLDWISLLQSLF